MKLKQNNSPRLFLAVSMALLGHAVLGIWLSSWDFGKDQPPTVRFELVSSLSSTESAASTPAAAAEPATTAKKAPPIEPTIPAEPKVPPRVVQTQAPAARAAPTLPQEIAKKPDASKISARKPVSATETAQTRSTPAIASRAQAKSPDSALSSKEGIAEKSRVTTHDGPIISDYEIKMKERIAAIIGSEPFMQALTQAQTVELELQLMTGGMVRRTKILRSSGSDVMDKAAIRAALNASPYGEPPEEDQPEGLRYRIVLTFSPTYL